LGRSPVEVSATGGAFLQPGVEDVAFISLRYSGGVLGTIEASWLNPKKVRRITVVGSQRMATWDDLDPAAPLAVYEKGAALQEYGDFGEFLRLSMWDGDIRLPKVPADEPLRLQAESFLRSIRAGECEQSDAGQALSVVRSLEAVVSSLQQKGAPVPLQDEVRSP
jgi:predicted dehydrogenase